MFAKGRDFGAWLGMVPKQLSTGGRTILGKVSKRGNTYLRTLFVQAARVVLVRRESWERYGLKSWIEAGARGLHPNKLAAAGPGCVESPGTMIDPQCGDRDLGDGRAPDRLEAGC